MADSSTAIPVQLGDLVAVLGASIGDDLARHALLEGARRIDLDPDAMVREDALRLLDHVSEVPGIVGVCARFGRSRLMLQWARDDLRNRDRHG